MGPGHVTLVGGLEHINLDAATWAKDGDQPINFGRQNSTKDTENWIEVHLTQKICLLYKVCELVIEASSSLVFEDTPFASFYQILFIFFNF